MARTKTPIKFSCRLRNAELTFESIPGSLPPTNVHAIVGADTMSPLCKLSEGDIPFDRVLALTFSPFGGPLERIQSEQAIVNLGMVDLRQGADTGIAVDYLAGLPGFDDEVAQESIGHEIVLHAIAGLLRNMRKRTLVLIYEPEMHLSLTLQSTFMHALRMLLPPESIAVIATHSPVILREIPRSCIWSMRRFVDVADRPQQETYGESIGVLASNLLHLEMSKVGFHAQIQEASKGRTYEEAKELFGGNLAGEARAVLRAHCMHNERAPDRISDDTGDLATSVVSDPPKVQRRVRARKTTKVQES